MNVLTRMLLRSVTQRFNVANSNLEGPSTQYLRTLVPEAINGMVFGARVLNYWLLGPSG